MAALRDRKIQLLTTSPVIFKNTGIDVFKRISRRRLRGARNEKVLPNVARLFKKDFVSE